MENATQILENRLIAETRIKTLKNRVSSLPQVCTARARFITESYKETEGEPIVIKRAKALNHLLSNISIGIYDGELIVGNYIETPGARGAPVMIEYASAWLGDELEMLSTRHVDKLFISEENKEVLRGLLPFWKGRTVNEKNFSLMPEELRVMYLGWSGAATSAIAGILGGGQGLAHISVDYEKVIVQGLESVTWEAEERLKQMNLADPAQLAKFHFYRAVLITHKAVVDFATRYAELARGLERKEHDSQRKAELREIAEICESVPAKPARTFHEALQSFWFTQIALLNEGFGWAFAPGRMDQYLLPFYRRDMEEGRLDREKAKELLLCLFIKLNSLAGLIPTDVAEIYGGFPVLQLVVLGGLTCDGTDATNELSYLMLEADGELSMQQPECVIRVHKGTPRDFLVKACEVAKRTRGKLKFINDDMAVQKLLSMGYTVEDARDYVLIGCYEQFVPKKSHFVCGGRINLPMCLELALNRGIGRLSGKQLGPDTGDPREFKSIQDVLKAYRTQVAYILEHLVQISNVGLEAHAQWAPTPFQSSLVQECLGKGVDLTAGGALYNISWMSGCGIVNVGDSLAALKKCVFDEGEVTMEELIEALDKDFEGKEHILQMLMAAPKFGNDDDYVDLLTREAASIYCEEWQKLKVQGMRQAIASADNLTAGIPFGRALAASPEGRKSGEPLADGGVSPMHGRNIRGPAATYKSVAKLDHVKMKCGSVLNMRFSPDVLRDERALQKFATLLQTYFDLGGYHVQFNIASTDMLRDAQRNPEKYRDLLVRVATWSSYFVELSTDVQNDIIKRIEFQEM